MPLFQRLMGLETEYAIRIRPSPSEYFGMIRTPRDAFEAIFSALQKRLPTAKADPTHSGKRGLFLGTGGAIWLESIRPSANLGLVEGATPECRDPYDLVAAQRAQDRILGRIAANYGVPLLKNCRDGQGHAYGAQENYEVEFARGLSLSVWRLYVMLVLFPLSVVANTIAPCLMVLVTMAILPFTALITLLIRPVQSPSQRIKTFDFLIGPVWRRGWDTVEVFVPGILSKTTLWLLATMIRPVHLMTSLGLRMTRMDQLHRDLSTFLVSRIVIAGAGRVNEAGRFELAQKAGDISRLVSCTWIGRGIFSIGQFLKPILLLIRIGEALEPRQRLQVNLGDSNLCEEAEYLRVGTTSLVIEACEAGALRNLPQLIDPVAALLACNSDPTLQTRCCMSDGRLLTAIQIQRMFHRACEQYVRSLVDEDAAAMERADDILQRWDDVLNRLEHNPESLVGRVDWITKQYLLRTAGQWLSLAAKQKLDLRYHELSPDGYFEQLDRTAMIHHVVAASDVEQAQRLPPPGTPAMARALYIREFSGSTGLTWRSGSERSRVQAK